MGLRIVGPTDAHVMADLDGTVLWASANGGDVGKLATTGFCRGGRIACRCTAQAPVKAAVAWYGRLAGATSELTPKNPVDLAASLKARVPGVYGGQDTGITRDTVAQMRTALAAADTPARPRKSWSIRKSRLPHR